MMGPTWKAAYPECRPAAVPPGPETLEVPGGCLASALWVWARGDTRPETWRQPGRRHFSGCLPSGQLGNAPSPPGQGPEPASEEVLGVGVRPATCGLPVQKGRPGHLVA